MTAVCLKFKVKENIMKRLLAFLFLMLTLCSALVSCADDVEYENIEYRENGLYFVLPNTMRRKTSSRHEFYFTNQNISIQSIPIIYWIIISY